MPARHFEVDPVDRPHLAETLAKAFGADGKVCGIGMRRGGFDRG